MFYVYVLRSDKDAKMYTGFTSDLKKRLVKHNTGKVFSTKSRLPVHCIYTEICLNEYDAKQRERYLKAGTGKKFLKTRLRYYLQGLNSKKVENT